MTATATTETLRTLSIQPLLSRLDACEEACGWAGDRDLATAWRDCQRGDWLLWLAARLEVDRRLVVRAACACARTSLHLVPAGEDRPRLAIEAAEAWARGEATIGEVRDAVDAAARAARAAYDAAYAAAYAARAARAAYAAAYVAAYAAYAATADDAAHAAAYAANAAAYAYAYAADAAAYAYAAVDAASLARSAELVREIIPVDAILAGAVIAE